MEFKVVADTLASVAAFVAIVGAMVSWYRSARRPLSVRRIVVHRKEDATIFILIVRNVKPYPVTINRADGYTEKVYQVQCKRGGKPEYSEFFPGSKQIFSAREVGEIPASGHTNVRIQVEGRRDVPTRILFLLETSHGYHELWCKEIAVIDIGAGQVYLVEYQQEYSSKAQAKAIYYWKWLVELTRRCSRRLRRG